MIQIENISVQYDGEYALRGVTFHAAAGERIALMGPNGAGKSTLLLVLVGVLPLSAGTVVINQIRLDKKNLPLLRREAGLLFQNPDDQLFMPTVREDIVFGPRNNGIPESECEAKAETALTQLDGLHLKRRMTHKLSGGEKRLAALAGLLVMEPSVLLMDEPTAFLDPRATRRLIEIINALKQTMLIATHDRDLARATCSRVILMKDGGIFADAPAGEILQNEKLLLDGGL